jgi:hypothetical protein
MTGIVRLKKFLSDKRIKRLLWAALILAMVVSGWRALTSYDMSSVFVTGAFYQIFLEFNDIKHRRTI